MADEENKENQEGAAPEKKALDIKKLMTYGFVAVNLFTMVAGAYLVYIGTVGYEPKVTSEAELNREIQSLRADLQTEAVIYTMDTFNTNLEGLPRRFVRMQIAVEMYDQEGFEEVITSGGESRDAIMKVVNAKTLNEIDSVQGKLSLKTELIAEVNHLLDRGVVKDLYFTKFQVQ